MPYSVNVRSNNHTHSYTITPEESHTGKEAARLSLDGSIYQLDWQQLLPLQRGSSGQEGSSIPAVGGSYSVLIGGKSYQVFARLLPEEPFQAGQTYEIFLAGQRFEVNVEDERTKMLAGKTGTRSGSGATRISAPMPGLVVNILVQPGDSVEQGQAVVILEAMKMENDLAASISGTIKEVNVQKGQTVEQNQVLVIIEHVS